MPLKARTRVVQKQSLQPTGIVIEGTGMKFKPGPDGKPTASQDVIYYEDEVSIVLAIKGQKSQEYEIEITIKGVAVTVKGKLEKNGWNIMPYKYPFITFNLYP